MRLVELCAGSAAVSAGLLEGKAPAPYMGSKGRYVAQLRAHLSERLRHVVLVEPGEWGSTLRTVLERPGDVAAHLRAWVPEGDRDLFDRLRAAPPPEDPAERAAAHLYLQTRTYRSKPVYPDAGRWRTHGFDPEYRPNKNPGPNTNSRGWYLPRLAIAARVEAFAALPWPGRGSGVEVLQCGAQSVVPCGGATVYLDPPYQGTTSYEHGLSREGVVALARAWQAAGSRVVVSEAEPLDALVAEGWRAHPLRRATQETLSRRGAEEWVTVSPS